MSKTKTLLIIGLVACFLLTGSSLYRFLYNHVPLTFEKRCLEVSMDGGQKYRVLVVKNHPVEGQAETILEIPVEGLKYYLRMSATYENLRDMNAKRISCDEKIN